MEKDKCWIEIHQVCGDCGRRIKKVISIKKDMNEEEKRLLLKIIKNYLPKYNMACNFCSNKKQGGKRW